MSLRDLNPETRRRLRLHGWVLTLWCVFVGGLASWILLRRLGMHDPVFRYAASALVMYALGLVVGTRVWLKYFAEQVREEAWLAEPATAAERAAFDDTRERKRESGSRSWDWGDLLGDAADLFSFDEAAWLLLIPAIALLVFGLLMSLGLLPVMLADGLAAMLAEVAVQFVFGTLIARRVLRPRSADDAFLHIVGKTWLAGVLLVLLSALLGYALVRFHPGAASIADLFR